MSGKTGRLEFFGKDTASVAESAASCAIPANEAVYKAWTNPGIIRGASFRAPSACVGVPSSGGIWPNNRLKAELQPIAQVH
jgi:hypothetical protein